MIFQSWGLNPGLFPATLTESGSSRFSVDTDSKKRGWGLIKEDISNTDLCSPATHTNNPSFPIYTQLNKKKVKYSEILRVVKFRIRLNMQFWLLWVDSFGCCGWGRRMESQCLMGTDERVLHTDLGTAA